MGETRMNRGGNARETYGTHVGEKWGKRERFAEEPWENYGGILAEFLENRGRTVGESRRNRG